MIELRLEHIICRTGIGKRAVRVIELRTTIELVCGSQCTWLTLVVEHLHIDRIVTRQVDIHLRTQELLGKQRKVETVRVETGKVATLELVCYLARHLLELRTILYVLVIDAMHRRCNLGNVHSRINALAILDLTAIGIDFNITDLDNAVPCYVYTRSLEVEEYYRFLKIQFHIIL